MSAEWTQAVDAQTDLIAFWRSTQGRRYGVAYAESLASHPPVYENGEVVDTAEQAIDDDAYHESISLVGKTAGALGRAEPIWVAGDVVTLMQVASESPTFQPVPVFADDLLTDHGFALFAAPLYIQDWRRKKIAIRAFQWHRCQLGDNPGAEGCIIAFYSHRLDDDDFSDRVKEEGGLDYIPRMGGTDLILAHIGAIRFGDDKPLGEFSQRGMMTLVEVFWRLAQQEVMIPSRGPLDRATRRRAAKWKEIKTVVVYTLRRVRQPRREEGEERGVEWSHRWLVNGHWRNQPYKIEGKTVHRQIWIDLYEKGPEDKPLVVKQRVYDFRR